MKFTLVFSAILLCVAIYASTAESSKREKRAWGLEWGSRMLGIGKKEDPKTQNTEKNDKSQKTSSNGLKEILPSESVSQYDRDPDKPVEDVKLKDRALQIEISDGDIVDEDELDYVQNSRRVPNVYGGGNIPSSYENYGLPMVPQRGPSRMQRPQQSRNSMQNSYGATNMNTNMNTNMDQQGYGMESRGRLTDGIITNDGQCRCDCRGANGGASYFNQFESQRYENNMSPRVPSRGPQSGRYNNGQMNQQSTTSQSMNQQTYDPRMEHQMSRINSHNNGFNGYNEQTNSYGSSGFSSESLSNNGWGDSSDDVYGQIDEDADYQNMQSSSSSSSSSSSMNQQQEDNNDDPIFPNVELPTIGSTPTSLDPERKIAQKDPQASMSIAEKIVSQNGYNGDKIAPQSSSSSSMDDSSRKNRYTSSYTSTSSNNYNPGQSSSSSYSSSSASKNNQNMNDQSNYQSTNFGSGFGDEDVLPLEVYPDPNSLADRIRIANEANGQHVTYKGLIGGSSPNSYRPKNEGMSIAEKIALANKGSQPSVSASRARPSNMNSQPSSYSSNDMSDSNANSGRSNMNSYTSGYSSNDIASTIAKNNRPNMQQSSSKMTSSTTSTSSNTDSGSSKGNGMLIDDDSLMLPSIGSPSALLSRRNDKLPSPNGQ